jgi:hypothetical protein
MTNISFENYGLIESQLSNEVYHALLKECLSENKKEFKSRLTEQSLAEEIKIVKHFYLKDNIKNLYDVVGAMINQYRYEYSNYFNNNLKNASGNLELGEPWINIQKKHEYVPYHEHEGILSYVIWIKMPVKSIFEFSYTNILGNILPHKIILDSKNEGQMIMFPSSLRHMVYPFQESEETRISISGNVIIK